jgi:predicted nucleic-acid-binding protein
VIALDTNVLVRFIVEDDDEQTKRTVRLIEDALAKDEPLFVSEVVLCEAVWVLARVYKLSKEELVQTLRALLQAREVDIQAKEGVRRAVDAFAGGKGDFADYVIREVATAAGCDRIATFDKALLGEPEFFRP